MLNTGALLKKPGESNYAIFRRFLISNHLSFRNSQLLRKLIIQELQVKKTNSINIDNRVTNQDLIVELNSINNHSEKNQQEDYYRSNFNKIFKNCPDCAELGYHTSLFNIPWIKKCPVHNKNLLSSCHKCKLPWPSESKIRKRNCSGCGSKVSEKLLVKRNAFHINKKFYDLKLLDSFLNFNSNRFKTCYLADAYGQVPKRFGINSKCSFLPSVICYLNNTKIKDVKTFQRLGIEFNEVVAIKFKIKITNSNAPQEKLKIRHKTLVVKKIYSQAINFLKQVNGPSHKVGQCLNQSFSSHSTCASCKTWLLFYRLFPNSQFNLLDVDGLKIFGNSWYIFKELQAIHGQSHSISFPSKMTFMEIFNDERMKKIVLPDNLKTLIYLIDIWSTFIHVYQSFVYLEAQKTKKLTFDKIKSLTPALAKSENRLSCPFYFFEKNDIATLIFPRCVLNRDKKSLHKQIQFLEL